MTGVRFSTTTGMVIYIVGVNHEALRGGEAGGAGAGAVEVGAGAEAGAEAGVIGAGAVG